MADNGGWYTRRKRKHDVAVKSDDNKEVSVAEKDSPSSKISTTNEKSKSGASRTATFVSESLLPHLGWTKLSACHRPRSKNKRRRDNNNNWNRDEALQKVTGRALVRGV